MVELANSFPAVNVVPAEYKRLLGYPADRELDGRARELADWAADWYREHGRPWVYARPVDDVEIHGDFLKLDGTGFHCHELLKNLRDADATGIVIAAVSAGPELEATAQQAWREEKPDEYFFLEVYGSAVVEHLVTMAGAQICAWAEGAKMAVLPHYSPGYGEWSIGEQPRLMEVIRGRRDLPGPLEVLDSGMLRPKKSLLAVFGLTAAVDRAKQLSALVPCERCSFLSCQYRRSEYRNADEVRDLELASLGRIIDTIAEINGAASQRVAQYKISRKALDRWANERLTITPGEDGTIDVLFKHEGTTCSNMGRPLLFDYHVRLSSPEHGYRILEQECKPAIHDIGHESMCSYLKDPVQTMSAIANEKPLLGRTLDDVLNWQRASTAASCYCDTMNRLHMWGQVLETIHYALHRERYRTRSQELER
jgi:hypothetical protein